jgi:NTP pyrophosphatase (non-canonical NTP hydrolase)
MASENLHTDILAKNLVSELEDTMLYFVNFANILEKEGSCHFDLYDHANKSKDDILLYFYYIVKKLFS